MNQVKEINIEYKKDILRLINNLNPNIAPNVLESRLLAMFNYNNYKCFGLFENDKLIGLTSCWTTVRFYSGLQIEIDNFIVDEAYRSKGVGNLFLDFITDWAKNNRYETIELNTYVNNYKSHKFYFNQDFKILGFHFQKNINNQ